MFKNAELVYNLSGSSLTGQSRQNRNRLIQLREVTTGDDDGGILVVILQRTSTSDGIQGVYGIYHPDEDQFRFKNTSTHGFSTIGGSAPASLTGLVKNGIDSYIDIDGTIHVGFLQNNAGAGGVKYTTITTTTAGVAAWSGTVETASATVPDTSASEMRIGITADTTNVPHLVWAGLHSSAGDDRMWYTNRLGGSWAAEVAVHATEETNGPLFLRYSNGLLGLFYTDASDDTINLFTRGVAAADAWDTTPFNITNKTANDDSGITDTRELGIGGDNSWTVVESNNAWHIMGTDYSNTMAFYTYVEIPSKLPLHIEHLTEGVFTADDWSYYNEGRVSDPGSSGTMFPPALAVSDDGEMVSAILSFSNTSGLFGDIDFQKTRLSRADGWEPGYASPVFGQFASISVFGYHAAVSIKSDRLFYITNNSDLTLYCVSATPLRKDSAGLTHDVTVDGTGFMLAGPMNKVDITASIPRISIATDQKKHFDFSERDTFEQNTWHQGRGEKYLMNPEAFSDSDGMLTHIPNQITQALQSYTSGRTTGAVALAAAASTTTISSASATSLSTFVDTTVGSNRVLIVSVHINSATVTTDTMVIDNRQATLLGRITTAANTTEIWIQGDVASSATTGVTAYFTAAPGNGAAAMNVHYYKDCHPSNFYTAITASGTGTAITVTATGVVANELVFEATTINQNATLTPGAGQSAQAFASAAGFSHSTSTESSTGSVVMDNTSSVSGTWGTLTIAIRPGTSSFAAHPANFFVYNANMYVIIHDTASTNNALYVWDNTNSEWDVVAAGLDTATGDPHDFAMYGGDLWIAQGETVNMRTYDLSAVAWEDGTVPARAICTWDNKLWRADNLNELYWSTDPDAGTPTWTQVPATGIGIADADSFINRLIVYQDALFIMKEDRVLAVERASTDTYVVREISNEDPYRDVDDGSGSDNGMAAFVDRGLMYWNRREQVVRFDGSTVTLMGPERGSDTLGSNFIGLPADERGEFRQFTSDGAFMYGALSVEHDTTNVYNQIMVHNGIGWHSFWKGITLGNLTEAVFFLPVRTTTGVTTYPTLWFGDGNTIRFIKLPRNSYNPTDDTTLQYIHTGFIELAHYDAGLPDVDKVFSELFLDLNPMPGSTTSPGVTAAIKLNELDSSSLAGHDVTSTWWMLADDCIVDADMNRLQMGEPKTDTGYIAFGGVSGGNVVGRKIATRLSITAGSADNSTVVIRGIGYRFVSKPLARFGWTVPIKIYDGMRRLDNYIEDRTNDELKQILYEARSSTAPIVLDDGEGDSRILTNKVQDPEFRVTGFTTTVGTLVTNSFCTLHKKYGEKSQFITATNTGECGVSLSIATSDPSQSLYGSVWILNWGPRPVTLQLKNSSTVLSEHTVFPSNEWQKAEVSASGVQTTDGADITVVMSVVGKASYDALSFHISGAQLFYGTSEPVEFTSGERPGCFWEATPHASESVRRVGRRVYVTGISEVFRFRDTSSEQPRYDSEVTIQMREVL